MLYFAILSFDTLFNQCTLVFSYKLGHNLKKEPLNKNTDTTTWPHYRDLKLQKKVV